MTGPMTGRDCDHCGRTGVTTAVMGWDRTAHVCVDCLRSAHATLTALTGRDSACDHWVRLRLTCDHCHCQTFGSQLVTFGPPGSSHIGRIHVCLQCIEMTIAHIASAIGESDR